MKWSAEAKVGLVTIVGVLLFTFVVLTLAHAEIFGKPGFVVIRNSRMPMACKKGIPSAMSASTSVRLKV